MSNIALALFLLLFGVTLLIETKIPGWVVGLSACIAGLLVLFGGSGAWWKRTPLILLSSLLLFTGCSLTPVPKTVVSFTIAGVKFEYSNPKQCVASNFVAEVSSNGVARVSIGALSSVNDPAVVDKSYAGAAMLATAIGTQVNQGIQNGASAAGKGALMAHEVGVATNRFLLIERQ